MIPAHIVSALVSSSHLAIDSDRFSCFGSILARLTVLPAVVRWPDLIARMLIISLMLLKVVVIVLVDGFC